MIINELKQIVSEIETLQFALPDGAFVPEHFHLTEMGTKTKHFIDCGNTIRQETVISFQIWTAQDVEHRLSVSKFRTIIQTAQPLWNNQNFEIEVEYQVDSTLGIFGLTFHHHIFYLTPKYTTCLAQDHCGIPPEKMILSLPSVKPTSCCQSDTCC